MSKKYFFFILVLLSGCTPDNQPTKITDTFFDKYKNEGVDSAIDYLFSTNKWTSQSKDNINNVKNELNHSVKEMGTFYGYELISTRDINENIREYTFQLRYDLQPIRFKIIFYKPQDEWRVQNFSYDTKLFDE